MTVQNSTRPASIRKSALSTALTLAAFGIPVLILELAINYIGGYKVGFQLGSFEAWGLPGILLSSLAITILLALVGFILGMVFNGVAGRKK